MVDACRLRYGAAAGGSEMPDVALAVIVTGIFWIGLLYVKTVERL